jgi:hypothetical protein
MIEIAGLVLAVVGILFAFETPRTKFLSLLGSRTSSATSSTPSSHTSLSEHDRELVRRFRALFADPGLFQLYQRHDFLLPFSQEALRPLYTVVEAWTTEAHFFSNPELRSKQAIFIRAANELAGEIVRYTVPDGNGNVTVISRHMDPESLPSHVRDEARAIDAKLPAFLRSHEELLEKCNELT